MTVPAEVGAPQGEARLLPGLFDFLRTSGRLRADTIVVEELPWHGRRVDMVTLTRSGVLSSYELKLNNFGRVLEQATYNQLSFDRSWIVVGRQPNELNLALAERFRIGVIVICGGAKMLVPAPLIRCEEMVLRQRLAYKIRALGKSYV